MASWATLNFFAWLEKNAQDIFSGGPAREYAVAKSCQMKADIVARDERENGDRAAAQSRPHVRPRARSLRPDFPIGCCMAKRSRSACRSRWNFPRATNSCARPMSTARSAISPQRSADGDVGVRGGAADLDTLMDLIAQDKKVKRGKLTFILARGVGAAFVAPDVDARDVRGFLGEKLTKTSRRKNHRSHEHPRSAC